MLRPHLISMFGCLPAVPPLLVVLERCAAMEPAFSLPPSLSTDRRMVTADNPNSSRRDFTESSGDRVVQKRDLLLQR